jgi:hypothetical protein
MTTTQAASGPAISFDERRWPLVRITFRGNASDDEFDGYLARMTQLVSRGQKIATLLDARGTGAVSPVQRKKQAEWQKRHADALRRNVVGTAFVIDSSLVRGALTAILWLSPLPQPHHVTATPEEAERWARHQLQASGGNVEAASSASDRG